MENIVNIDGLKSLENNRVIMRNENDSFEMVDSEISFTGKGNILYIEPGVKLHDSNLNFKGNNSIIYLSSSEYPSRLFIDIYNDSTCYIGRNCSFNRRMNIILSEQKNVIIGNDGLFSFDIWIRNGDPHLIYDLHTKKRINNSKSIYIGDHVWIGQNAILLKGAQIGSGSIIGASSVTSSNVESNCSLAGNPGKVRRRGIFWLRPSVHTWRANKTRQYKVVEDDEAKDFIFMKNGGSDHIKYLENNLKQLKEPDDRLEFIINEISSNEDRERFSQCSKATLRYYKNDKLKRKIKKRLRRILKIFKLK